MKAWHVAAAAGALLLLGSGKATAKSKAYGMTRAFDDIYRRRCPTIPVEYLRALAKKESDANPGAANPGEGWGLLQVVESVRTSYNKRFATDFSKQDLLDPDVNATIACELIARIAVLYAQWYPSVFGSSFDWTDTRSVQILTYGWNVGWSDSTGVARVIKQLRREGVAGRDITADAIYQRFLLGIPGVAEYLARGPGFAKAVTRLYMQQLREPAV